MALLLIKSSWLIRTNVTHWLIKDVVHVHVILMVHHSPCRLGVSETGEKIELNN